MYLVLALIDSNELCADNVKVINEKKTTKFFIYIDDIIY
jgi:hypothetical protein